MVARRSRHSEGRYLHRPAGGGGLDHRRRHLHHVQPITPGRAGLLIVLDGTVERLDLPRVEGQRLLWVRHGGIDRVADHLERPTQGDPQGIIEDDPPVTPVQRGIVLRVGHFEPSAIGGIKSLNQDNLFIIK